MLLGGHEWYILAENNWRIMGGNKWHIYVRYLTRRSRRCRGRIGRGGLGRVLRVLVEARLERRELGHEQGDKLAHLGWGGLPGVLTQFSWALWLFHTRSMPDSADSRNTERCLAPRPERIPAKYGK